MSSGAGAMAGHGGGDVPQIPGFYFDPQRKKYFKILPNSQAPRGTTNFYTQNNVALLKDAKKDEASPAPVYVRDVGARRARSSALHMDLKRELGLLTPRQILDTPLHSDVLKWEPKEVGIRWRPVPYDQFTCIDTLYSPDGFRVAMGTSRGYMCSNPKPAGEKVKENLWVSKPFGFGTISSVSIASNGLILFTTTGGAGYKPGYCIEVPEMPGQERPRHEWKFETRTPWCSTVRTFEGNYSPTFAVGSDGCLTFINNPTSLRETITSHVLKGDVVAVDFRRDTYSEQVIFGLREGGVGICDARNRPMQTCQAKIFHDTMVTGVRSLNEMLVIAKGPHYCALYDLRYPHPPAPSASYAKPTMPLMRYHDLGSRDPAYEPTGAWAVSKSGDLMAGTVKVPTHEYVLRGPGREIVEIGIWSTKTGQRLDPGALRKPRNDPYKNLPASGMAALRDMNKELPYGPDSKKVWRVKGSPKCMKFVEVAEGTERLWVVGERSVQQFGW